MCACVCVSVCMHMSVGAGRVGEGRLQIIGRDMILKVLPSMLRTWKLSSRLEHTAVL